MVKSAFPTGMVANNAVLSSVRKFAFILSRFVFFIFILLRVLLLKLIVRFIYLDNFKKGFVVINGFNLGRYWEIGPQKSLYVPSSILKEGENEIVVFESDGLKGEAVVEFKNYPTLE